jgi:hypothetical protein
MRTRVAFVGGVRKVEREIVALGAEMGVAVEVHDGRTRGQGVEQLTALVHRTDCVVIVTGTNSHNAMHVAKREAAKVGARVVILKSCGAGTARAVLGRCLLQSTCRQN